MARKNSWPIVFGAVAIGLVVAALVLWGPGHQWSSLATAATPEGKAATSELAVLQKGDYSTHYGTLASSDRAKVTEAEWVRRCQEESATLGKLNSYTILGTRKLSQPQSAVAVSVRLEYANLKQPIETELYYISEGGALRPTMLWGTVVTR